MPERLKRLESMLSGKRSRFAFRLHGWLPQRKSPAAIAIALILLVIATALKPLADSLLGAPLPPFIFYYPLVVIVALFAGVRISLVVALASVLLAWFWFLTPQGSFAIDGTVAAVSLEIFALISILLALAVGFARYTLDLAVASEELRDYDAKEAVHRIKNLLAVVQAIVLGTRRDTVDREEYDALLLRRLGSMAAAQDILHTRNEAPASADELVQAALGPFLPSSKIVVDCDAAAFVPVRYVHGLTLALFELATNSAKHGALGAAAGTIEISCRSQGEEVRLVWRETAGGAGDAVGIATASEGFGSKLIRVALRRDQGTDVTYAQDADGVIATFCWTR